MANVRFTGRPVYSSLYFANLALNDSFRIVGAEAVYRKVAVGVATRKEYMLEEATGKLWDATTSPVEKVAVEVTVHAREYARR